MSERSDLLTALATTVEDYRVGDLAPRTPDDVDCWIQQFGTAIQVPLLREMDHVLKQTYFTKANVSEFFSKLISQKALAGDTPCEYWQRAHFLDIQQQGHSQTEIRQVFGEALTDQCGLEIDNCGADGGDYLYLDDVLFTGGRIGNDLSAWIASDAPAKGTVHVVVIAAHRFGEWKCSERLKREATGAGKKLTFHIWAALRIENRKSRSAVSEVLWPAIVPQDDALAAYMAAEQKFPFEPRTPGGKLEHPIFSSEEGRQLLERELLLAGMRIRSFSQNPSKALRPLGFSPFGLGFGSMIVTYRNCPNNVLLALWWGDPTAAADHPFSKWCPVLPRKTYAQEFEF